MTYREAPPPVCPRCAELMPRATAGQRRVPACRSCGGVFLDLDATRALIERGAEELVALADDAARAPPLARESAPCPCPLCGHPMERRRIHTARCALDVCAAHGVWFDRWEVGALARAAEAMRRVRGGPALLWTALGLARR